MQTETLDKRAEGIAATLTDKLLAPVGATLACLEAVFPGITERVTATMDLGAIKTALNADVARSIQGLMDEGTEDSLTTAIGKVKELRGLVAGSTAHTQEEGIKTLAAFEIAYDGQYSKLEVRPGQLGKREVQFTLKRGAENLVLACDEINDAMKGAKNYPTRTYFRVYLSDNKDLPAGTNDIVVQYTPVIRDSGNRERDGEDAETSHTALLKTLNLGFVNNDLHRLATGALRIKEGFPKKSKDIGTTSDEGDLNEGLIVRTAKGACSGAVMSYGNGVYDYSCYDAPASLMLVVAGASPRN